jgi:hypothetical protein
MTLSSDLLPHRYRNRQGGIIVIYGTTAAAGIITRSSGFPAGAARQTAPGSASPP